MAKSITLNDFENSAAAKLNPHLFKKETPVVKQKRSKYNSEKTDVDGFEFDSKKEANRYKDLRILLKAGDIGFLAKQVEFSFHIKGVKIGSYLADFMYTDAKTGKVIVEDVKSEATRKLPVYRLKRRMMLAQHNIKIVEV